MKKHLSNRLTRLLLTCVFALAGMQVMHAQTVTISATGTTGSLRTGSVTSAGAKNDGNMITINSSGQRGWAMFSLSAVPAGATITSANVIFTTFNSTLSTAANSIRGFLGDPPTMAGATLYTTIGNATTINASSWTANALQTLAVNAAGITFLQTNIGGNIVLGYVRGSTNNYSIYGYPGTAAQVPKLEITYVLPCTGKPAAGTINGPASICPAVTLNLSVTGAATGTGISYQWQSRPAGGGSFTDIVGATTTTYATNLAVNTDFRFIVRCTASGQNDTTAVKSVAVNNFLTCYCTSGLGGSPNASIDRVKIYETTLDNPTPGSAPGFYTAYPPTGSTTATLQQGAFYSYLVAYGASAIGSAWLDINHNGVFETTEWIQLNTTGTQGVGMFQVPPTALTGITAMRVRSNAAGGANGAADPCTNMPNGETEDYQVNIVPAPVNDLRMLSFLAPNSGDSLCAFADIPMQVVVHNNGSATQTNIKVYAVLTGPVNNSYVINYPNNIVPFDKDTITVGTFNLPLPGVYQMRMYNVSGADSNPLNDTSEIHSFVVKNPTPVPYVFNDTVCVGREATVKVLYDGLVHRWYDKYQGGNKVFEGDTIIYPALTKDSILYVTSQFLTFKQGSLLTQNVGGNGCGGGAMFNVIPNSNMTIDSFNARFNGTGAQPVNIYYRVGGFAGFETNSGAWTQVGTTVNVNAPNTTSLVNIVPTVPLQLNANVTYGIYLNYNASYTNGSPTFSNADVTITGGTGLCSAFGGTNASRMFNGTVFYSSGTTGCASERVPIAAIVAEPPVVDLGSDVQFCEGPAYVLDAGNAGASYIWNTQDITQTISTFYTGTYWVVVDKYCASSDTVHIIRDPLPSITGITFVRSANHYTYSPSGLKNTKTVLWLFGDGSSDTAMHPQHQYPTGDNYLVTLIAFNDCGSDTFSMVIPLHVKDISVQHQVNVYPNPAKDVLTLSAEAGITIGEVWIINSTGSVVYSKQQGPLAKQQVDISNLPSGHYIIRMNTSGGMVNKPFQVLR